MTENPIRKRAEQLVDRLMQLDLHDPEQRAKAVERMTQVISAQCGLTLLQPVIEEFEAWAKESGSAGGPFLDCAESLKEVVPTFAHATMDEWWETTSYQDEIGVDDQLFRDKPIRLKRIALEAFNAARRASVE